MYLRPHSWINRGLIGFLNVISLPYKSVSWLVLKKRSLKQKAHPHCYIISVDNLAFGGTGKTALVIALGGYLNRRDIRFAVISRGYRSRYQKTGTRVLPGHTVADVGDEAVLYRRHFPNRDIFVGRNRHQSVEMARSRHNKIMILDDGFQTTSIKKDLKIMLLNPHHPYYYLRHFKRLIKGEDIVLRYGSGQETGPGDHILDTTYSFAPEGFFDPRDRALEVRDAPLAGFSALGDNRRFRDDLRRYNLKTFRGFPDHHPFTQRDIQELDRMRDRHGARYLVCTEKDFVKLSGLDLSGCPLLYLKNTLQFKDDVFTLIINHARERGFV